MDLYLEQGMDPEGRHEAGGKGPGDQQKGCIPGAGGEKAITSREQMFSGLQTVYTLPGSWRPAQIRSPRLHHI